jgi:signal recognition particle subunit SRP19
LETIIWPVYIDSGKSRKEGRKISKKIAISEPKLSEIAKAAKKLNMNPKKEEDKSYPGFWWENSGRIIVEREDISKNKVLTEISETIRSLRE